MNAEEKLIQTKQEILNLKQNVQNAIAQLDNNIKQFQNKKEASIKQLVIKIQQLEKSNANIQREIEFTGEEDPKTQEMKKLTKKISEQENIIQKLNDKLVDLKNEGKDIYKELNDILFSQIEGNIT